MIVAPGDLVLVKYLDLDDAPTVAYQVIAVYDVHFRRQFFYFHLGHTRIYDAPVDILDDKNLEVRIVRPSVNVGGMLCYD